MPKINWKWIKNEILPPKRRESAPPMPTEKYDPNAHRKEYKQAFQEFKQRGSLYNQSLVREVKVESDSKSTDAPTDQSNSNGEQHDQPQSDATKRRSLPNKKSRSVFGGSSQRKTNTANNTLVVNENNNSIYSNEIREFEDNCINDASFGGATNHSPPKTFYKNNSNPFSPNAQKASPNALKASPNAQKTSPNAQKASPNALKASPNAQKPLTIQSESSTTAPIHSESSSPARTLSKIEGSRQRACKKLFSYVRPKDKSEVSSNSSGAFRPYDFDSSLDDEEAFEKPSNGQHIPKETYDEIANAFGDMAQRNGLGDERNKHNNSHNSSVPPIEHGNSGVSPQSALASFRRCEGVIDENFGFLDDTEWRKYCMDDSESSAANHDEPSIQVTDLDESVERLSEHDISDQPEQQEVDTEDQCSRHTEPATSPQVNKHPIYIIECKAKDIKPKSSSLRNTTATPFQLSSGSFRQTTVTLKKGCPRDSESMRLVEEAIERDFEILSKVKHPNIVILMAACFNRKLINHMTLVMEPVDYTLNFYLHQMGKTFTILESISIVQQISSAALYLQECGYIHSNISSHNVLFRERPCTVKLSSFELATDVDYAAIRAEVEKFCPQFCTSQSGNYSKTQQSIRAELDNIDLKKQYKELSKPPATFKRSTNAEHDYMGIPIKYLVYDTTYRQHLSVPNVTAPELLAIDQRFVFPTPKTDVYSLCLLLWELLNQCGPFAVYNRLDMQRMIASRKLNLPFFERERCYYLMDIFGAGLLIEPENRSLTVSQLIEQLENIELEILTGGEEIPVESNERNGEIVEHDYVNGPQQAQSEYLDESFAVSKESAQLNDFVLSPDLLAFDQSLKKSERTSTKKMKKKAPRNPVVCRIRELFTQEPEPNPSENFYLTCGDAYPMQETADSAALCDSGDGNFVDLNRSFIEMSDDIRRHVFDDIEEDEKLNQNLADIAQDLCRNILNDTEDIKSIESRSQPSSNPKNSKTAPAVVGFSVKNKKLNDSKTHGGFLETPAAAAARKLFDFSPDGYDFNCDGGMHNSMPNFARQNYIRRNAWLSDQQPNTSNNDNESERMVKDDKNENLIDVNKKVNVSLRIVHNKMTPEKAPKNTNAATHERPSKAATEERPSKAATEERPSKAATKECPSKAATKECPSKAATKECPSRASTEERPSILSKIQFFNSANQASAAGTSLSNEKRRNAPVKAHEVTTSLSKQPTNRLTKSVNERVFAAVPSNVPKLVGNNTEASGTSKADRNVMGELTDIVHNLHNGARDPAQKKESFENKLWKRELDICNRSLNSSDGGNDMKIAAAKLRSVRETILKFEKRRHDATTSNESASNSSSTSNGELAKTSSKPSISNQSANRKPNDSPTLIKRTVYSEQIVSGIDLSPLDNQMFDKLNFGNKKVAARVSFRQTSSSDVAVTTRRQICGRTDMRGLTICGSEVELLTFSDGTLNSSGVGSSDGVTVCFNCASTMSSDELKALTHETLNISVNSDSIPLQESPTKRCQARVKTQDTRSIEDLYIDDDFVHGLGANMELQSNYSDSFDFDMISSGLF